MQTLPAHSTWACPYLPSQNIKHTHTWSVNNPKQTFFLNKLYVIPSFHWTHLLMGCFFCAGINGPHVLQDRTSQWCPSGTWPIQPWEGLPPPLRLQVFRRRSLALAHSPIYSFIAYKRNRVISKMQTKESKGHWFLKHCTWVVPEKSSITVISRNTEKVQISGSHPNVLIKEGWVQCSNLQVFKTPLAHQPHWPWCPARFGVLSNSKYLLEVDNLSSRNPRAEEPTALEGLLWNPSLCSDTRCFLRNSLLCLNFVLWYKSKKMLTPSFVQNLLFEAKCPYFQNIF